MFTGLFVKLINILLIFFCCLSHSASISTLNNLSSSNQYQFMSNSSYRNFLLRQYFIDLLNISHASIVRSMIYESRYTNIVRRKRSNDDLTNNIPMFTLQSSHCFMIDQQVQSTFIWSHSIESLGSIELIYHIDSMEMQRSIRKLKLIFKHPQTLNELLIVNTYLEFDLNRDFYSINLFEYFLQIDDNQQLIIESYLINETCQSSHPYIIIASNNHSNEPIQDSSLTTTTCKLKQIQIKFEDLGLAYLIIRPREYTFTYCDGTCSFQQPSSIHAIFQSIVNRKNPTVPQPTCVPSEFADDNFLLRQIDGTMEIYPIKDVIVKQCTCL